jgi:ubiquitin carboxyl-terminal hydrolase 7
VDVLEHMLRHAGHAVDLLYYELLDIPLPELEQLKTFTVRAEGFLGGVVAGSHVVAGLLTGRRASAGAQSSVLSMLQQLRTFAVRAWGSVGVGLQAAG